MKDLEDSEEEKGKAIDFAISAVGTRLIKHAWLQTRALTQF